MKITNFDPAASPVLGGPTVTGSAPATSDYGLGVGTRWIDTTTGHEYVLVGIAAGTPPSATWIETTVGAPADILDIPTAETDTALVLAPDGVGGVEFRAGAAGDVATDPIFDAKGDLVVGTGADASARLPIGSDNYVLRVATDSPAWEAEFDATSPSTQAFGDAAVVGSAATAARRDHKHAMPAEPGALVNPMTTGGDLIYMNPTGGAVVLSEAGPFSK